jgi:hypothetical protein
MIIVNIGNLSHMKFFKSVSDTRRFKLKTVTEGKVVAN